MNKAVVYLIESVFCQVIGIYWNIHLAPLRTNFQGILWDSMKCTGFLLGYLILSPDPENRIVVWNWEMAGNSSSNRSLWWWWVLLMLSLWASVKMLCLRPSPQIEHLGACWPILYLALSAMMVETDSKGRVDLTARSTQGREVQPDWPSECWDSQECSESWKQLLYPLPQQLSVGAVWHVSHRGKQTTGDTSEAPIYYCL